MRNRLILLFLWTSVSGLCLHAQQAIQLTDLQRIKSISALQVRPDGREIAYAVRAIAPPDTGGKAKYRPETQWYTQQLPAGKQPAPPQALAPAFSQVLYSPDGRRWALGKDADKKTQLFTLPNDGSTPVQVTRLAQGVGQVRFSPDGAKVLLSRSLNLRELVADKDFNPTGAPPKWPFEKPGDSANSSLLPLAVTANADGDASQIAAYLLGNEQAGLAKVTNKLQFQTENSTTGELRFTHWYLLSLQGGQQPVPLTTGWRSHAGADFLTSNSVLLSAESDTGEHPDRVASTAIYLLDLKSKTQRKIIDDSIHRYQVAAVSASGKWVAISKGKQNALALGELLVYDTRTWTPRAITFDRSQSDVQFAEDEKSIYFISPSNGGRTLNRANLSTGAVHGLSPDSEGINDYWVGGGKAIYSKTTFANPAELYIANDRLKEETALTAINSTWLQVKDIGLAQKYSLRNELGLTVDYWLLKPIGFTEGQRYPLIVEIHGGPASMFGPADASMWHEYQYLRARGYGVLFSNPRGSSGYGEAFLKANFKDWGPGPARDVLAAVDSAQQTGWVDSTQLFLTGGSYGAYLTTWILAHDQRFRAASSQRGVYDLYVFFGSANVWPMLKRYFDGFPWESGMADLLRSQSPSSYVDQINTPLLIFHGEQDNRTGPVQSDFLYKQLKVLKRQVEYVRHPGADHEITRSGDLSQRFDQLLRTYEFFERFRNPKK